MKKKSGFYSGFLWGVAGDSSVVTFWDGKNFLNHGYGEPISQYGSCTAFISENPIDLNHSKGSMKDVLSWKFSEHESGYYVSELPSGELTIIFWSQTSKQAFVVGAKEGKDIDAYKYVSQEKLQFDGDDEVCTYSEWERRIVKARQSDLESLVGLYTTIFGSETWRGNSAEAIRISFGQEIDNGNVLLSFNPQGEMTGFITFLCSNSGFKDLERNVVVYHGKTTVVTELGVDVNHRNIGFGTFLLKSVEDLASDNGDTRMQIHADKMTEEVIRIINRRKFEKSDNGIYLYEKLV